MSLCYLSVFSLGGRSSLRCICASDAHVPAVVAIFYLFTQSCGGGVDSCVPTGNVVAWPVIFLLV